MHRKLLLSTYPLFATLICQPTIAQPPHPSRLTRPSDPGPTYSWSGGPGQALAVNCAVCGVAGPAILTSGPRLAKKSQRCSFCWGPPSSLWIESAGSQKKSVSHMCAGNQISKHVAGSKSLENLLVSR
jgi:hypothetical protein